MSVSGEQVQTTRFRVWLKSGVRTDWTGVKLVRPPEFIAADVVDVTVEGDGSDLKSFINKRWKTVDAWVLLKPEESSPKWPSGVPEPPQQPHRHHD